MDNRLESDLYKAMVCEDIQLFKSFLEDGANANEYYFDSEYDNVVSLLHVACEMGKINFVHELIKHQATLDVADNNGLTPLMYALAQHKTDVADLLLKTKPELAHDEDCNGFTAVDLAAIDGNVEAVFLLAGHGADMNHTMFDGTTPVMRVIWQGIMKDSGPVLQALVDCGADVNVKDKKCRRSALQLASLKKNTSAAEVLLAAGADMYSLDSGAKTPLTNMLLQHVRNRNGSLFIHEDIWTILLLMEHAGIDYNRYVFEDADPMATAALLKAEPLIRFFLANGANPNKQTALGATTLLKCASRNDFPSVQTLVEWNSNLYLKGKYYKKLEDFEYTVDAYEVAILQGHFSIAKFLIDAGYLDFQKPYLFNKAPLPKALAEDPEMVEWLRERSSNPESLTLLSVFAIRRVLRLDAVSSVKKLPLPPKLQRMVILKDLLNLDVDI